MQQAAEATSAANDASSAIPTSGRSSNGAALTDEQILGIGAEDTAAPSREEEGVQPAASQDSTAVGEAARAQDAGRDARGAVRDAPPVPEWLKPLFADPKVGREVQSLWDRHQAYLDVFPTVAEARAFKELFPGGAEAAKKLLAESEEVAEVDDAYFSADPRVQSQLAANLYQDDPAAFRSMLSQSARVLAERDPAAYHALSSDILASALQAEQFDQHVELMRQARERGDSEALGRLTDQLIKWSQKFGSASPPAAGRPATAKDPQQAELARQREQLQREQQEFRASQYGAFQQSANDAVVSQVRQSIEAATAAVLPTGISDGAKKRIAEDIFAEVNSTLQGDRGLTRQVAGILRQWNFDEQTKQQVVNLIFGRAKALIPTVAKRIVSDWTTSVLSANRQKTAKQQAAAKRVDIVGGGAPEAVPRRPLTPKDIDYSKTTDDQLLNS
jgi:hypothetical protein